MAPKFLKAGNPYMPLWEHVPDGEPRVFEYKGEKRIYVYGSHDTLLNEYCGLDYVVWSAPVTDLTNWTCHGTCWTARDGQPLFAPDVVQRGDTFYMYVSEARGSKCCVASSKNPAGPFENPVDTKFGFDPGVLVDDDNRVYGYWGFCGANCAELNDDMATFKEGTYHAHQVGHCSAPWAKNDDGHLDYNFGFFEASSPRKVLGKYVFIYSKNYNEPKPELGVVPNNNGFLSYAYSDHPLDGYVYGGDISFNGGEIITLPNGENRMTYPWGNNHGSIMQVNGQWYVFYHRQTGLDEYSRQAMLEPVDVALGKDGKLYIGKITYKDGEPVSSCPVEMTSSGAAVNGLNARSLISAGRTIHLYDGKNVATTEKKDRAYILPVREERWNVSSPVVNIKNETTVGFRYLQFGNNSPEKAVVNVKALTDIKVQIIADSYDGKVIGETEIRESESNTFIPIIIPMSSSLIGKRAIYFKFLARAVQPTDPAIAEFDSFYFE